MNKESLIYLILAIIFLILVFIVIIYNIFSGPINNNNNNNNKTCNVPIEKLINVTSITNCVDVNNVITPFKYICPKDNFPLFATISNVETPYLTACAGFCTSGNFTNGVCNETNNTNYNTCISLTKPVNCNSLALPVAYDDNNIKYYINNANTGLCFNPVCQ